VSAPTYLERCREWLLEQVEIMGTLRTANVRDLAFKNWRQNTVTVLQRIWPEDHERVERFRRIVFTPPHARPDAKLAREWFGKGLGESRGYLTSLLAIIDREGVPEPAADERERDGDAIENEVDFPMLDLDANASESSPAEPDEAPVAVDESGLGVTPGYTTPDEQGATPRDPATPAPPSLHLRMRTPAPAARPRPEASDDAGPPALGEADADPAPSSNDDRPAIEIPRAPSRAPAGEPEDEEKAPAPAKAGPPDAEPDRPAAAAPARPAPRGKNGRSKLRKVAAKVAAAAAAKSAPPARPVEPPKPVEAAKPAEAAKPVEAAKPAEAAKPVVAAKTAEAPRPVVTAKTDAPKPPAATSAADAQKPRLKDLLGLSDFEARSEQPFEDEAVESPAEDDEPVATGHAAVPEVEAEEPAAEAEPEAAVPDDPEADFGDDDPEADFGDEEPEADDESPEEIAEGQRMALDFLLNSPVFGAIGRPVQRRTDTTEFLDPDAVAIATYAVDLARLGVPEAMRVSLAARLVEVARHLENGELDWGLLRALVTDAMQYPELARRLMPVLLPWFERAA